MAMGLGPSAPGGHTKLLRATRKQRDILLSHPAKHPQNKQKSNITDGKSDQTERQVHSRNTHLQFVFAAFTEKNN
jgi:hypothetical protein